MHRAARIAAAGHGGQVLVSASTAPLVELELRDLGEHRFKDLSAPERVYQLGRGEFPVLEALGRMNLPVAASPLLGREAELHDITAQIRAIGDLLGRLGRPVPAAAALQKAHTIAEEIGDLEGLCLAERDLAWIEHKLGRTEVAIDLARMALERAR